MGNYDKRDMPVYLIVLSLIFIFPLGIYFLVLKTDNKLYGIKRVSKILKMAGNICLAFMIVYFFVNYNLYVSLIDSHMSLDMYSFKFVYVYIFLLMFTISTLWGGIYLNNKCEKLVIYTEFVNIRHIKDINLIKDETLEDIEEIKLNINKLIEKGFLINIRLDGEHLVSTKTVEKDEEGLLVKCKSCGNVKKIDNDKVRCDFCFRKLNKKDRL